MDYPLSLVHETHVRRKEVMQQNKQVAVINKTRRVMYMSEKVFQQSNNWHIQLHFLPHTC